MKIKYNIVGFVYAICLVIFSHSSVSAATPPDSCFAFNTGTGIITNYYNNEANNIANPACPKDVDIPGTIAGAPVTRIGNLSFRGKSITSVTIPLSVTSIGQQTFYGNLLTTVVIPGNVLSIDAYAFFNNPISTLTLGEGVQTIGNYSFENNQIASLVIPNSVTSIGINSFRNNLVTDLSLGNGVQTIGTSAFSRNRLTSLVMPNSVVTIGDQSFGRNQLESVTLSTSLAAIPNGAFYLNSLNSVVIPPSVVSIGTSSFAENTLTSVALSTGLVSIADFAFQSNRLESLSLPNSVTSIGQNSFSLNHIESLTLSSSLISIPTRAFWINKIKSVQVPDSVVSIAGDAFTWQSEHARGIYAMIVSNPDKDVVNEGLDSIWYVKLYTADSSNPNGLVSAGEQESMLATPTDYNADGDLTDSLGGHLINPASIVLKYTTPTDISIQQTRMMTGIGLSSYLASENITNNLSLYWVIGQTVDVTAPSIEGYTTPGPATRQVTLSLADNVIELSYPVSSTDSSSGDVLAETGANVYVLMSGAFMMLAGALALLVRMKFVK